MLVGELKNEPKTWLHSSRCATSLELARAPFQSATSPPMRSADPFERLCLGEETQKFCM